MSEEIDQSVVADIPAYKKAQAEALENMRRSRLGHPHIVVPLHKDLNGFSRNFQKQLRKQAKAHAKKKRRKEKLESQTNN